MPEKLFMINCKEVLKLNLGDRIDMFCMIELEKEEISKLAERIVNVFEGYVLLSSDMSANDRNNLKNAKVELVALLRGEN